MSTALTPTTASTCTTLPLDTLKLDPMNVRNVGRGQSDPELRASIITNGIIEPLVCRPNGKGHAVYVGGRRLEQLEGLAKAGLLPVDHPVKVIIENVDDARAREISLSENLHRWAMHPVDEHRAFMKLRTDKEQPLDVEAIATRFGLDTRHVEQRLALGRLHDVVLDAWIAGSIDAKTAQAFTLCPDKKAQERIFKKHAKHGISAWNVKSELKVGHNNVGRFLNAIGIEAYEARGGKVTRDLFGSDHVVSDEKLVKAMLDDKLEAECARLMAEGWSWATTEAPNNNYAYGTIDPKLAPSAEETAELERLDRVINGDETSIDDTEDAEEAAERLQTAIRLRAFRPEQKARSGCFVTLARDGSLEIDYGRVKPVDKKAAAATKRADDKPRKAKKAEDVQISGALIGRLNIARTAAAAEAIKKEPELALTFALAALLADGYGGSCVCLSSKGIGAADADQDLDFAEAYTAVSKLSHKEQLAKFAEQVGLAFNFQTHMHEAAEIALVCSEIDGKALNAALRQGFDAKDYFDSVPKALCLAAITEAINADEARKVSGRPKGEIAAFAIANVPAKGWLPPELRTANYDGPQAKPAKAKSTGKPPAKAKARKGR